MQPSITDEAIRDQGAHTSHPSYTDKDFEGHRAHSVYAGALVGGPHRRHGHHRRHRHRHHHRKEDGDDDDSNRPATPPAQRVQFILGEECEDDTRETHPLFTEMEELFIESGEMEWRETARWIKFEEDVEEGGNRWSKPHVATLSLHSLFELRSCILNGTVMLDVEGNSLEMITDLLLDNMINQNQLPHDCQERVKDALLRRHRHQHEKRHDNNKGSRIPLIRSLADIGRVHSSSKSIQEGSYGTSQSSTSPLVVGLSDHPLFGRYLTPGNSNYQEGMTQSPSASSLSRNHSGGHLNPNGAPDGMSVSTSTSEMQQLKGNQHFMKKIPHGAEASNILVGELDFLDRTISAFIRLNQAVILGDLTEVPVPTRFIFILLGPQGNISRYHEIGRAIATLLTDEVFHEVAYKARKRQDLIAAVDEFLDAVTVLPPGEWDPSIRIEPPQKIPSQDHRKVPEQPKEEVDDEEEEERERDSSGLKRTGKLFGGLINDFKRKAPWYLSDFKDALALQCIASFFFLYFACLTPVITFGGLLGQATANNMATIESLVAGCVCGIIYALCSGQPLTILSSTGPVLVFETICFSICQKSDLDFLSLRLWIGVWTGVILLVLVSLDASAFVCYITRFTEENFACLISLIFIYKAVENVWHIYDHYPMDKNPELPVSNACDCVPSNSTTDPGLYNFSSISMENCSMYNGTMEGPGCGSIVQYQNIFLMSFVLFAFTYFIATGLKGVKTTTFFPTKVREVINDFAVTIAILSMTLLDYLIGLNTPKLVVPSELRPTLGNRGWFIAPFGRNPWWTSLVAVFPALLATILIFMDQQITAVIVNRKENKLRKGGGYHLDLFVLSLLMILCSIMGLPWFVAGTVLSVTHANSLKMESETAAPGEKPQYLGVREQRVTHLLIFIMMGCSVFLTPVLQCIPTPVLYGVFLYMGTSSLKGLQFIDRILIMFMPVKYQPDYIFLRQVPLKRVHVFTLIQILCLVCLWVVKSIEKISIAFPLMLVVLIGVRKCLDFVFTQRELKILDDVMPESTKRKREDEKRRKSLQLSDEGLNDEEKLDPGLKIGPSGNLQIPLANGNIMKIPVDKVKYDNKMNISEEVAKTGIWKQVNNAKPNEETNGTKPKKDSSKKKRGTKKDALNDEERKRLSTMAEEDDEDDMPITIKIESPTPIESKTNSPGGDRKSSLAANHNETSV